MALRIAIFTLMAVGLLGFGAVAWISTWPSAPEPAIAEEHAPPPVAAPPPARTTVLVAAHQLRAGTFMKGDDLRAQEFVIGQVPQGATIDSAAARGQLNGAMIRHSLSDGQVVLNDDVLRPGDHGFLAAVLEPGMRAMTFTAADVTTDWGLIWPGDHLDIILTQQFDEVGTAARHRIAAETIIRDVRVVAVDRQLVQGETADETEHRGTRTLTIEVSPTDSEHLVVAQRLGKITLALRSAAPVNQAANQMTGGTTGQFVAQPPNAAWPNMVAANPTGAPSSVMGPVMSDASSQPGSVTWGGDVAHALDQPPPPEPIVVRIFRGSEDGKEFKF
jgi:pilus assembly protein CpaB